MTTHTPDILIIGAGILGVTTALEIKKRQPDTKITIIEKEKNAGFHASGRNSGVLHAGFYYTADSLKARFCRDGNRAMRTFCKENKLPLNENGKLVITKNQDELKTLHTLHERGLHNGTTVFLLDEKQTREIEPRARTHEYALFSPETASVDPQAVMQCLVTQAQNAGIRLCYDEAHLQYHRKNKKVITTKNSYTPGYVINAAGLHADRIAKQFSFSKHTEIVPFKGLYLYSDELPGTLRTHLYPVPDLNYPFLGVHFTVTVHGKTKIGPTAIPALWREHYSGFDRFSLRDMTQIVKRESIMFAQNKSHFRQVARHELKKYSKSYLAQQAAYMIDDMDISRYKTWGKPGIRAQLIDKRTNTLVNDFCFEGDKASFHILNAVSPAFTCSLPFATYLVDNIVKLRNG